LFLCFIVASIDVVTYKKIEERKQKQNKNTNLHRP